MQANSNALLRAIALSICAMCCSAIALSSAALPFA